MKIIFLSQDGSIHRLIDALKGDIHLAKSEEQVLELLDEVDEDEECLLFLDFDGDQKKSEKFNKSIQTNDWITRIIISGEMKVKDFKKHQKGKTAAHGYVLKPFTGEVFKSILNDLEISHLIEEQNLYEEGTKMPELPTAPQGVRGFENAPLTSESLEDDEDLDVADEGTEEFGAQEFNMSTQVRELVDMHSVKGGISPFDGQLNESIQAKFDEVFGYEPESSYESDFGSANSPDEGFSLREETQDSIALDLDASSDDVGELDLGGDDGEIDLEADLDLSADDEEIDLGGEEVLFEDEEEIDLEAIDGEASESEGEVDLSLGAEESDDEIDLDEDDDEELDLGSDDELDLGGDDLDLGEDEVELSEDLDDELTRLTEERSLPTKEELSEFEEDTGEMEILPNESNDEMQFDKPDNPTMDNSILDDDDDDFELDDQLQVSDSTEEEASEGMSMSDEDQNDELLEFEDDEVEAEGELAFSTESESDEPEQASDEEEGGLDFNLGAVDKDEDEDEDDELDLGGGSSDDSGEAGGFELSGGDDLDDMEIESGGVSSSGDLDLGGDDDGGDLDLGSDDGDDEALDLGADDSTSDLVSDSDEDDDDEFDLGTDAALSADDSDEESSDEGALEFSDSDDEEGDLDFGSDQGEEESAPQQAAPVSNSEFDDDELDFDDDEDEELEKTQAVSLSDIKGGPDDSGLADEFDDDEEEDLDFGEEDNNELDDAGTSEFESDEELLNDEFGEDTNPTVVMSQEATRDLENMMDDQITNEFRPQGMEESDTAIMDDDDFDLDEGFSEEEEAQEQVEEIEAMDAPPPPAAQAKAPRAKEEGSLKITPPEDRMPPSFNEGEAVRLQATIRQLREEREELLKEIQDLKRDKKVTESENLGLKAELDEAKIEISILKKRHSSEIDEMKYRLRITDEKKLYAEEKAKKLQKEFDRLQSKVRVDFNHIKQREKELESQLELVKMDTESQVQSRDKKILELKRKIDQLEFNMENVVIREQKSRDDKVRLEERLERIMKTLRGSIEVLEDDIEFDSETKRNRD